MPGCATQNNFHFPVRFPTRIPHWLTVGRFVRPLKAKAMNNVNCSRNLAAPTRAGYFLACRGVASARSRIVFLLAGSLAIPATHTAGLAATNTPSAIPWNEIGAKAGANYQGDGLAVTPAGTGARLHCVFQRLDGEATPEGLWLTSTVTNTVKDRFRIVAAEVGRAAGADAAATGSR